MTRARRRTVLAAAGLAPLLGACGGAPPVAPPTGVDGLSIPTPSPRPEDFVDRVDNPWLGVREGVLWEYAVNAPGVTSARVTVEPGERVLGLPTTALVTRARDAEDREPWSVRDLLAQDRAGNVWWAGRDVSGSPPAATSGFRATATTGPGLLMAAAPRLGDGYLCLSGGPEVRATVVADSQRVTVPAGRFLDVVEVRFRTADPARGDVAEDDVRAFARGTGLIARWGTDWGTWRLRAHRA
jgi:hypothetical protein